MSQPCPTCNGSGEVERFKTKTGLPWIDDCPQCGGRGIIESTEPRSAASTDAKEPSGDDTLTEILTTFRAGKYSRVETINGTTTQHDGLAEARTQLLQYIEGVIGEDERYLSNGMTNFKIDTRNALRAEQRQGAHE